MRHAALLASVGAMAAALLTDTAVPVQEAGPGSAFVAFRFDDDHVIATLRVFDTSAGQVRDGLSSEPRARFGYRYFDPPAAWLEHGAADMRVGDRWLIHAAAGRVIQAETERIVGGNAGCQDAIAVLLRVSPGQSATFTALPAKYFLAERSTPLLLSNEQSGSTVGVARSPSSAEFGGALRSTLEALLARELPGVLTEGAPGLARMASSTAGYYRSWARQQQAVDNAMQRGRGELKYDIQSFRLAPDGVPLHFVRAVWTVQRRQGFAASLWLRGASHVDVIQTHLRPASWLRTFEFRGSVAPEHLGLILNTFDRDHDGWGEVLVAQGGYESMELSLLEYSPTGLQRTGIEYGYGC